ncbi:MAG: M24 family metallopeptidase [Solirubrobacteraceae bacterium]
MTDATAWIACNVHRAHAALEAADIDAVVSSRPEDAAYLTPRRAFIYRALAEGRLGEVVILRADGDPVLVTMDAYVPYYESVGIVARPLTELEAVVRKTTEGASRVAVPGECPHSLHRLVAANVGARATDADPLAAARQTKHEGEVAAIAAAATLAQAGMAAMLGACCAGQTEAEVVSCGEATMRALGAESLCFSTLCIGGPELGLMREVTTTRVLQEGDWVMLDGGCALDGYNAEFARSVRIGGPNDFYMSAYRAVYDAQRRAIDSLRPGVSGATVDAVARAAIGDAGFGDYCYAHVTGHGIGTGVWELPVLGPAERAPLPTGAVVSVEPGVFIPGTGGIRIEDLVVVTESGAELLTDTSRALVLEEAALTTKEA